MFILYIIYILVKKEVFNLAIESIRNIIKIPMSETEYFSLKYIYSLKLQS